MFQYKPSYHDVVTLKGKAITKPQLNCIELDIGPPKLA